MTESEIIAAEGPLGLGALPAGQCYDCVVCGECCSGIFNVALRPEEAERIQAQGWEADPALQGVPLLVRQGSGYRVANRENGACVFLDETNHCRIHAKFGLEAKPLACQLYPFKLIPTDHDVRADLRFDCPEVAANRGRPLEVCRADVQRMVAALAPAPVPSVTFRAGISLSWACVERVTDTFLRQLDEPSLDLTQRVVGCVQMSAILRHLNQEALGPQNLVSVLETILTTVRMAAEQDAMERIPPSSVALRSFRQLLVVYARDDRYGAREPLLRRLSHFLRMVGGRGLVPPVRAGLPEVPFDALEMPLGLPPDRVVEPLARCLRVRVASHGFFGRGFAGYDYLDGLDALLLTYPAVFWFARVFAAGEGLPAPDATCLERAIRLVHHVHGLAAVFRVPLERYHLRTLCNPVVLRKLVVWYGS